MVSHFLCELLTASAKSISFYRVDAAHYLSENLRGNGGKPSCIDRNEYFDLRIKLQSYRKLNLYQVMSKPTQ